MNFAKRLTELRELQFLSKTKLAEDLKISRQIITKYENGDMMPNLVIFAMIADYFGVTADYLLGRCNG
jgi:transcriptional regulator with XRE-family HTH domain